VCVCVCVCVFSFDDLLAPEDQHNVSNAVAPGIQ